GLPPYEDQFDDLGPMTNEDVAKAVGKLEPRSRVGEKYEYSNTAYALLALIVARTSGQPFPQYVKAHVFDRIGMTSTLVMDRAGMQIPGRAVGYKTSRKKKKGTKTRNDTGIVGDGQVIT